MAHTLANKWHFVTTRDCLELHITLLGWETDPELDVAGAGLRFAHSLHLLAKALCKTSREILRLWLREVTCEKKTLSMVPQQVCKQIRI
jgi:hypothetical protein